MAGAAAAVQNHTIKVKIYVDGVEEPQFLEAYGKDAAEELENAILQCVSPYDSFSTWFEVNMFPQDDGDIEITCLSKDGKIPFPETYKNKVFETFNLEDLIDGEITFEFK